MKHIYLLLDIKSSKKVQILITLLAKVMIQLLSQIILLLLFQVPELHLEWRCKFLFIKCVGTEILTNELGKSIGQG